MKTNHLKITIIGAGHGGLALAAHFAQKGSQVCLAAMPGHTGFLNKVAENNNKISIIQARKTESQIQLTTTSAKDAMQDSEVVFICVPSYAHEDAFRFVLPYIENHHKIYTLAGNFSALSLSQILKDSKPGSQCIISDLASLPYACRVDESGNCVQIFGTKKEMGMASIPSLHTHEALSVISDVFPTKLKAYEHVLQVGLNITSGISHPIATLFNCGRIGKDKQNYYFYKDGISEHTAKLLDVLDRDRQKIGELYGFKMQPYTEIMNEFYDFKAESISSFFANSPVHNQQYLCPKSLKERYINQDVPYVIAPWYLLGVEKGYESKIMRNIIEIASIMNNVDYLEQGKKILKAYFASKDSVQAANDPVIENETKLMMSCINSYHELECRCYGE